VENYLSSKEIGIGIQRYASTVTNYYRETTVTTVGTSGQPMSTSMTPPSLTGGRLLSMSTLKMELTILKSSSIQIIFLLKSGVHAHLGIYY
jgi:hypothetical protein